jgi:ABC-2 type transport system ATP-binding protein
VIPKGLGVIEILCSNIQMSVLSVKNLRKSFKKGFIPKTVEVLKGVEFDLPQGTITGFLGGNGAGKTTTLKRVLGLAFPEKGDITFFNGRPLDNETKKKIGFLPERPYFYEHLTGEEFLRFYGELSLRMTRPVLLDRIDKLLKRVDLLQARHKRLREYSKGMLQKIGVAQALIHDPEFVILDEPMSGLDPDGRFYLSEIIRETARDGKTVFFSSHLLHDAEKLCQRLVIMKGGKVTYQGPTEDFLKKMGDAAIVTYIASGNKQTKRTESQDELQKVLGQLTAQSAQVLEVRPDRNLEDAFIKMGLRDESP